MTNLAVDHLVSWGRILGRVRHFAGEPGYAAEDAVGGVLALAARGGDVA